MKFLAIIFDMDGTILKTEHIWQAATVQMLTDRGIKLPPAELEQLLSQSRGIGIEPGCLLLKMTAGLSEDVPTLARELATKANQHFEQDLRFIEGFVEFHHTATNSHALKTGLATNAACSTLDVAKRSLNLERFFGTHIYNASHVNNRPKPDPALFLHTADQLEMHPHNCVVIEDSVHGVSAAKDAGMFCIGINTAGQPHNLKDADFIIDHYEHIDLTRLLKKIN